MSALDVNTGPGEGEEIEMEVLSDRFPEYDGLDYDSLEAERDRLFSDDLITRADSSKRLIYVHNRLKQLDQQAAVNQFGGTSWIDDDLEYTQTDIGAIRELGVKNYLSKFINSRFNGEMTDTQSKFIKLTRSMLAVTHCRATRPLLNNEVGHELLRHLATLEAGE